MNRLFPCAGPSARGFRDRNRTCGVRRGRDTADAQSCFVDAGKQVREVQEDVGVRHDHDMLAAVAFEDFLKECLAAHFD